MITTRNPKGYWDWYVIGGRWNGVLLGDITFNKDGTVYDNCILCAKLVLDNIELPNAIVTPDGEWHNFQPTLSGWAEYVRRILWHHAEHYAVAVDCHK